MPPVIPTLSQSLPFPSEARSQTLPVPAEQLALVMPTARPGAAAVILFDETLRLLELGAGSAQTSRVDKGYLPQVSGGSLQAISPAVVPDACAYLQSRLLVVYDLAKQRHQMHLATDDLEETPVEARWLSVEPRHIAVLVRDLTRYLDTGQVDFRLRVLDLGGPEAETVGQLELGNDGGFVWDAGAGVLVLRKDNAVQVHGPALDGPLDHPLARALGALLAGSGGLRLEGLRLHPTQPVAVFTVAGVASSEKDQDRDVSGIWRATWDAQEAKLTPLVKLSPLERVTLGEFSPDGGWLTYHQTEPDPPRLYAQQVLGTPGPPYALGPLEDAENLLWTRAPLALAAVMPSKQRVTRWDFGKTPAP
ncbi:hypothetical protein [Corallococcus llansteffanensis]|uniref:Uncharacterized protein n=1 Tax=Corallococcus llansteffanensis TaxID=2316731 RepID=A0A3A8PC93_9BACT|nr:hypothetical protein [Corallococcus llansteffanensis]RKH52191.1 hypothetical protein D7V93_28265 [Corallococcus llansteffanensis]